MASTANAPSGVEAAKKISSQTWKTVLAVTVAGVAVGAGAWYILSQPNDKKKPRKSSGGARRKSKTKKEDKVEKIEEPPTENSTPSTSVDSSARTSTITPVPPPSSTTAYPENLFPKDVDSLSAATRAELAKSAKTLGNKYYGEKKYQEAIDLYSQAIVLQPDAVFYSNRAACYSNLNEYDRVVEDCSEALKLDPNYVKALNRRAQGYEHLERWADALNDYTVICVLEEFKNDAVLSSTDRVLKTLAQNKATELMKTKIARLPSDTFIAAYMDSFRPTSKGAAEIAAHEAVEEGDRQVQRAYKAIADRKWNEAYEATVASIDSGKLSSFFEPLAYNLRATFSFLRGDVELAFADLEKSLNLDPENVNTIIKRASIFMERANVEQAINEYNRAIEIDPKDPDVYYHRGQIRVLTHDNYGAVEDYKKSISLDENFVYAHIQLGVAQYKLGDVGSAVATFEKATRKFKESGEVYNYHGEILLDTQQFEEAVKNFNKAIELMPTSPLPYINKAILYLQWKQDTQTAEAECRKAIEVDPLCDMAYAQLAQLLLHQGKFEASLEAYDKAADLARTEPELANTIALREAAAAQLYVAKHYPTVMARLRGEIA